MKDILLATKSKEETAQKKEEVWPDAMLQNYYWDIYSDEEFIMSEILG